MLNNFQINCRANDKKAIKRQLVKCCSLIRWYYVWQIGEHRRFIENNRFSIFRFGEVKIYAEFEILEQTNRYVFATLEVSRLGDTFGVTYAMYIMKGGGSRGRRVLPIEESEEAYTPSRSKASPYCHQIGLKKCLVALKRSCIRQYAIHGQNTAQQRSMGEWDFQIEPLHVLARQGKNSLVSVHISWKRKGKAWCSPCRSHAFVCVVHWINKSDVWKQPQWK